MDKPFLDLCAGYEETHRAYHTLQHLSECLDLLEACRGDIPPAGLAMLELALWYHDIIYDVRSSHNEEKSADAALRWMAEWRRPGLEQARVRSLILATRHLAPPTEGLESWMVDIDLGILGAPPERYQEYERQVRQEYRWVPFFLFRQKRIEVLQGFLSRPSIYATPRWRDQLEASARHNLAWSLGQLQSGRN